MPDHASLYPKERHGPEALEARDRRAEPRLAVVRPRRLRDQHLLHGGAGGAGRIADHLAGMPPKGLAILSAKENGFAAGADIDEFTTISSAEQAMAFTHARQRGLRQDRGAALPDARHDPRLLHGRRHGAGARLPLPHRRRRPEDAHGAARGAHRHRAGLGRGEAHAAAHRRGQRARPHAHRARRRRPAREEAGPGGRRDAAAPLRQRGADVPRQAAGAAQAAVRGRRDRLAGRALDRGLDVAQEGGREGAPGPLSGALRDHRPVEGLRRRRAEHPRRAPGVDGEPLRAPDDAQPHPPVQAAGPHEGAGEGGRRAHPPPARDRRRRDGRRHRRLGGAQGHHGHAAGPRARAHRARHPARPRALQEAPEAAAPRPGGVRPPHPRRDGRRRARRPTSSSRPSSRTRRSSASSSPASSRG